MGMVIASRLCRMIVTPTSRSHNIRHEWLTAMALHLPRMKVRHTMGMTIFLNPSNGFGSPVIARKKNGEEIKKIRCSGPYRSAADEYKI